MRKRLSKKASWFKENHFKDEDDFYVGLDVHKDQYHVALWYDGRIGCVYSMSSDNRRLLRDLQQIKSFLLQYGISWPGGGWSRAVLCKLREMDIGSQLRFTLDQYLDEYEFICRKVAQTKSKLRQIFSSERHSAGITIFKSHPGVGNIVAWEYRAEMFGITRFRQPKACIAEQVAV